jgi:nicotinate-nucleotide adenylyltransferase
VWLAFDPDPISATALRRADPDWPSRYSAAGLRDAVSRRAID